RPVTVVVVDDDGDIRELLRLQFERDPRFEVVGEAADGEDAIAVAEALRPDLVVLDRQMPRLGGVEALPEIRRRAPSTAVVLYTAAADAPTYHAALAAGAVDVVPKRATGPDLVQTLVGALLARSASPDADI